MYYVYLLVYRLGVSLLILSLSQFSHSAVTKIQGIAPYFDSGIEQYRAAIYVESPSESLRADEVLVSAYSMAFRVVRSRLSPRTWIRDLSQRVAINGEVSAVELCADSITEIGGFYKKPFLAGDMIELTRTENRVEMFVNNISVGSVEQQGLFELLLNAWVGRVPPSSDFKNSLLNVSVSMTDALSFAEITDLSGRQSRVNEAIGQRVSLAVFSENVTTSGSGSENEILDSRSSDDALVESAGQENTISESLTDLDINISAPEIPESNSVSPILTSENQAVDFDENNLQEAELDSLSNIENNLSQLSLLEQSTDNEALPANMQSELQNESIENEELQKQIEKERLLQIATFRKDLQAHPVRFVRYPARSQERQEEGVVNLLVTIDRQGEVLDIALDSSSTYARLDRAAMLAVKKASPFPSLPEAMLGDKLEFLLPLAFRLER